MKNEISLLEIKAPHGETHLQRIFREISVDTSFHNSYASGCSVVELPLDVSEKVLRQAVEKAGYQYLKLNAYAIFSPLESSTEALGVVLCT
jgi:hypothetical protein